MDEQKPVKVSRRRPSFIWPIVLITIGVLFLLYNLGLVEGDFWTIIWQWWPVLLIAIGLDSLFRRNEIAGPVFLIGLAIVILASTLGFVGWSIWNILWRLWPILLVTVGIEIILRRRHLWVSVLVVLLIIGALIGVLWYFGFSTPQGEILSTTTVNQELGEIEYAEVEINPAVGNLTLQLAEDSTSLIRGEVDLGGGSEVYTDYEVKGETGYYKIDNRPFNTIPSFGTWKWNFGLTGTIPLQMIVSMGAGDMDLDFTNLILTGLEVSQGVGDITLTIANSGDYDIEVEQAIGSILVILPEEVGVRLKVDRAITNLDLPAGYNRDGEYYFSPAYEMMDNQVYLEISQAIGNISIQN